VKVYFVRHGEGEHNAKRLYSKPDFSLTDFGKTQAENAAKRFKTIPLDTIIASSYLRTRQTAEIISKVVKKEVVFSDLATEIKRPSEIAGKSMDDENVRAIRKLLDENFSKKDWHYSDEENFEDLRLRGLEFIKYLSKRSEENILVVSHLVFITMLVLTMMLEDKLTPEVFLRGYDFLTLETSGITLCQKNQKGGWELITWNDISHLGEGSDSSLIAG
jgi:broad specificity phosphatase PhoE